MNDLPPPPRISHAGQQRARQEQAPHAPRLRQRYQPPPGDAERYRHFLGSSHAPDPAVHRDIPIGLIVGVIAGALLLIAFVGLNGLGLDRALHFQPMTILVTREPLPAQTVIPSATVAPTATPQPPTPTIDPNRIELPAMDDAADVPANGHLLHLDAQPAVILPERGGQANALCRVRLVRDGRLLWVPCWRLGR